MGGKTARHDRNTGKKAAQVIGHIVRRAIPPSGFFRNRLEYNSFKIARQSFAESRWRGRRLV
jgi:hypothetical protein